MKCRRMLAVYHSTILMTTFVRQNVSVSKWTVSRAVYRESINDEARAVDLQTTLDETHSHLLEPDSYVCAGSTNVDSKAHHIRRRVVPHQMTNFVPCPHEVTATLACKASDGHRLLQTQSTLFAVLYDTPNISAKYTFAGYIFDALCTAK